MHAPTPSRRRPARLAARALASCAAPWLLAACVFAPNLEEHGYTSCTSEDACAPGRGCYSGLCTPPPWNDERFTQRQLVVVKNESEEDPLVAGAALPLRLGEGGLLPAEAFGVDGRLTYYSFAAEAWRPLPIWREVFDDHMVLFAPVQEELPPGGEAAFAWIEAVTNTLDPGFVADAPSVFPLWFDELEGDALDLERWKRWGTGSLNVGNSRINVPDNARLVSTTPLRPPFSLTFQGRINQQNCSAVFLGLTSGTGPGDDYPAVGFFVKSGLATELQVAPSVNTGLIQQPPDLDAIQLDTALHRYRLDVGSHQVRFALDGEVVGEPKGLFFQGEELYFTVDVDGACSFDLELVHASPLPYARPSLRAEEAVPFRYVD